MYRAQVACSCSGNLDVPQVPRSIAMGHGRRYVRTWGSEWRTRALEHRCNTCGALQWPSYEEVARGFTLPSLADYCPCTSRGRLDTQTARDGGGGADAWHDSPDGNTCWEECFQDSDGSSDAQPVWNWELQCFIGEDLSNQKPGIKRFAEMEVVAKTVVAAGTAVDRGRCLFRTMSDICQDGRAKMAGMEVLGTLPAGTTAGADKDEIDLLFDSHTCGTRRGALVEFTDIKPGLHLPPERCGTELYACWQGGDPIKIDSPLCAFGLCLTNECRCALEVVMAGHDSMGQGYGPVQAACCELHSRRSHRVIDRGKILLKPSSEDRMLLRAS